MSKGLLVASRAISFSIHRYITVVVRYEESVIRTTGGNNNDGHLIGHLVQCARVVEVKGKDEVVEVKVKGKDEVEVELKVASHSSSARACLSIALAGKQYEDSVVQLDKWPHLELLGLVFESLQRPFYVLKYLLVPVSVVWSLLQCDARCRGERDMVQGNSVQYRYHIMVASNMWTMPAACWTVGRDRPDWTPSESSAHSTPPSSSDSG